ncbi:TlyA family RNA methyltransferase [Mycoplasma sp. 'Moose RK']|uniref:TlyA family RNA methyltransferase n=1 Tax=Mycoplasma sp. 'Moose RK' TaxID=2780095 RepID=UPI0018C2F3B7|nr:TlyA family RNA methyltransferase [Mycoplasma sp. 'Moose RK']MBG0730933.1 TlyA family RNA methyltransferase [Mycoplasma sp. 'Moose RK']
MNLVEKIQKMGFENAESLIRAGYVKVNDQICWLPSQKISGLEQISINQKFPYVSRGALKLLAAHKQFLLDFSNKIILDIGASAGGFTEICLEKGAKKVFALDSGTNQLDYKLRVDPRVKVMEKTNIRLVNPAFFSDSLDFVVCDVSFISLKKVLVVVKNLLESGKFFLALLKPQFEASSKYVEKGGFVNEKYHQFLINRVVEFAKADFELIDSMKSPIKGLKAKNIEYFLLFRRKNDKL